MINLLIIVIFLTSIPVGYLLAYLCRDELVDGRKWFLALGLLSFLSSLILLIFYRKFEIIFTLLYISVVSLISLYMSSNKRFVR